MLTYRLVLTFAAPLFALLLAVRWLRGPESWADLRERLGLGGEGAAPCGTVLWLHGASNGELTSARDLIETLLQTDPSLGLVVTSNTLTGRDMVRNWHHERVEARIAPLDYRACLTAFLCRHRPTALVVLEGDLWPNRMVLAGEWGLPVALVSARISDKSAQKWRRRSGIAKAMFSAVRLFSAQDAASEQKYRDLGLPPEVIVPPLTLKASVRLAEPDPTLMAHYGQVFSRGETLLAASTHDGEEAQVIAAFQQAMRERPDLKMILAPRHPARGAEVAALLRQSGLSFRTRSAGDAPDRSAEVYLADTLGEMPLWYALAGQCFVGGSLVPKGGHTPFEPAQFDCAILHGPDLRNFAEPYAALDAAGGAISVNDAEELGRAVAALTDGTRAAMTVAARHALSAQGGSSLEHLVEQILRLATPAQRDRNGRPPEI
ncbi:3-deoxy-D-manno-octulosonic acid transferase [Tropicimonas isoalkanivorans]|uniref:3-deoxy-D-manno-octulosonic acid transferase n=1 Tax=Tropicimonas isoalkanivorans TaxID=441112 RepID=A0A1I1MYH4_9RHOB|nr:glycosyltransferase N-terminal domain-containing protein [Tropicimonas isoalkanivorans]SFC89962.1 3-deoxy-D-manno-octulosonic-acid transferase [Tropicimonas isoalkanivorans]